RRPAHGRLRRRFPRRLRRRRLSHCTLRRLALRRLPGRLLPPPPVLRRGGWLRLCVVLALAAGPLWVAPRVGLRRRIPVLVLSAEQKFRIATNCPSRPVADLGDHASGKRP